MTPASCSHNPSPRKLQVLLLALALGLCIGLLAALTALTQSALAQSNSATGDLTVPECSPNWETVPSPNLDSLNELNSIAVVSASDIWAVGSYGPSVYLPHTLTEHWNGATWSIVASPSPSAWGSSLSSVVAISSNDVWAVGANTTTQPPFSHFQTLVEHWDGSSWNVVTSPSPDPSFDNLHGVAAIATNNVWAVGFRGQTSETLVEHWNGTAWSVVSSPDPNNGNQLLAIAAITANDIWAVGVTFPAAVGQTLTEHWNGTAWSVVSSPNPGTDVDELHGVTAIASNDVWAVGDRRDTGGTTQTLTIHWTGGAWSTVASPNQGTDINRLHAVSALAGNNVRAVGYDTNGSVNQTLIEHWNGTAWNIINSADEGTSDTLYGVAAVTGGDVWAVGYFNDGSAQRTLIERYNLCTGSVTPTPTPAACPIQFTDVAVGSTFYDYIRCLACRTIVGGYNTSPPCTTGTPCFRPGDNVTRGQMAKFISNAAGYQNTIPPTQQTFTDVAPNTTFWLYIERAYLHQVIQGYTDAGHCPGGTPCFRPGDNVTRGQTAKFVSNAAGYQDTFLTTQQTFTDVPSSNTFWLYIERVNAHGVVQGYTTSPPCTTGTPCFLFGNPVSRGQTAKFISNAFFPNCQTP